jgi:hypothetical protein
LASAVAAAELLRALCWQQRAPGTFFGSCKNIIIVKPKPKHTAVKKFFRDLSEIIFFYFELTGKPA